MRPAIALHFLKADIPYDLSVFGLARERRRRANYVPVMTYPLDEMLGETPGELAWELYIRTCGPAWHGKLRRAVRPGDCFTFNDSVWAFIPARDAELFGDEMVASLGGRDDLPLKILHIS